MRKKSQGGQKAPKGSITKGTFFRHTAQSESDFRALKRRWGCGDAEVLRRALRQAVEQQAVAEK